MVSYSCERASLRRAKEPGARKLVPWETRFISTGTQVGTSTAGALRGRSDELQFFL